MKRRRRESTKGKFWVGVTRKSRDISLPKRGEENSLLKWRGKAGGYFLASSRRRRRRRRIEGT